MQPQVASESDVERLRVLRSRCDVLTDSVASDYRAFFDEKLKRFFRLPSEPPAAGLVSVTNTATALMALATAGAAEDVLLPAKSKDSVASRLAEQLQLLLDSKWASSDLSPNNAFTTSLVLRAAGTILRRKCIESAPLNALQRHCADEELVNGKAVAIGDTWRKFNGKKLGEIASAVLTGAPKSLGVMRYAPTPSIAYWLVNGSLDLGLHSNAGIFQKVGEWVAGEFVHQVSLITANHPALMDPVAMAMAAATCSALDRAIPELRRSVRLFPSKEELRHGVLLFMARQNEAGTWEKYFPLFHYPTAGANHCWHVEVLEALLHEFPAMLNDAGIVTRLELSISWLEKNRLNWNEGAKRFRGWNSGGQLETLARGEPESWATGVVHMFLCTLSSQLSDAIQTRLLRAAGVTKPAVINVRKWNEDVLDSHMSIKGSGGLSSLKDCIGKFMIEPIEKSEKVRGPLEELPDSNTVKRSALLFGPPGTGKTRTVRAIAQAIGWDFVEITPTSFLVNNGLDGVYAAAKDIFRDLRDLRRAVVFFDEMDAMLQRRVDEQGKPQLTVQQQFMTTSMLPHLAELYDAQRVLFFFATNYRTTFDLAITRAGRFDMLLFVGPPSWKEKASHIDKFAPLKDGDRAKAIGDLLLKWIPDGDPLQKALTRATFSETRGLFREVCQGKPLDVAIDDKSLDAGTFKATVGHWKDKEFSLCSDATLSKQYDDECGLSEVRW
jgi:hypothetical protein